MRTSQKEIQKAYAVLKDIARSRLDVGDIDGTMTYVGHCVVLAQQFNWIYADADLELMEKEIGEKLIPQHIEEYEVDSNRVVIFDDFCVTFILTLQYVEALLNAGKEVLLVTGLTYDTKETGMFFEYIKSLKGLNVMRINKSRKEQIQELYKAITDFHPAQILLHIEASSISVPILYRLPKQIKSYLINLADQTFWLGAEAIDYCIEFRPFGASVSIQRRGLKREQLLMLPFYPICDKKPFEGFPKEADGHVTIFSGGDIYKTLDRKRAYWRLIKRILDTHPEVRFLFATKNNPLGRKAIDEFVNANHFEDRFFYVGFRKDIYETLKHCDIYMGTCPTSGSLMSQLAAINAKPILQYYYPGTSDDETEQAVCINDQFAISFQNEEAFLREANKLINDAEYRKAQGERIQKSMIQPGQFDKALIQLLETNQSPFPIEIREVDYKLLDERWYELERCGLTNTMLYVYGLLGDKICRRHIPSLYVKKQLQTLKNKLGI